MTTMTALTADTHFESSRNATPRSPETHNARPQCTRKGRKVQPNPQSHLAQKKLQSHQRIFRQRGRRCPRPPLLPNATPKDGERRRRERGHLLFADALRHRCGRPPAANEKAACGTRWSDRVVLYVRGFLMLLYIMS